MPLFFTPPTAALVPMAVKSNHPGFALFKHFNNNAAGLNVFVVGGVVTTTEPDYAVTAPDRVYLGGHVHTVTPAERDLLVAAGYTVVETP